MKMSPLSACFTFIQYTACWVRADCAVCLDCTCIECQVANTDYATGYMFLDFMYKGKLTWPSIVYVSQ